MPLVMKEIEAKTEDPLEKATISKILQMKELSLSKFLRSLKYSLRTLGGGRYSCVELFKYKLFT